MHTHHQKHPAPAPSGPAGPATTTLTAVPAGAGHHNARPVSAEDIRLCAYRRWERAGKPTGDGVQFWLEAEQELIHRA